MATGNVSYLLLGQRPHPRVADVVRCSPLTSTPACPAVCSFPRLQAAFYLRAFRLSKRESRQIDDLTAVISEC